MSSFLISIITPIYNSEKFIEFTLNSVQSQTYKNWEMIIVDDVSQDNGPRIVEKYAKEDKRIKLIKLEKNGGGAVARNRAIKEAKGKYITFLDSDDLWHPQKLEKQVKFMEENNYDFTYTYYEKIDEEGNSLNKIVKSKDKVNYKDLLKSNQIGCLAAMYNAEKLGGIYMPLIKKRQDYALWLQVLKKVKYAYCLKENLAQYRIVNGSVSSNKIKLIKYNWKLFREVEKLSIFKSFYYLSWNIFTKLMLKR